MRIPSLLSLCFAFSLILSVSYAQNNETASNTTRLEKSEKSIFSFLGFGKKRNWDDKIKPGVAFKFNKGYKFSIGPKVTYQKALGKNKTLNSNVSYLPLKFKDLDDSNKLDYSQLQLKFTHHLSKKFFYTLGYDGNWFSPNSSLKQYVASRGGLIKSKFIHSASIALAQRVLKIDFSYKGRKRTIPFYLRATYRFADDYKYGTDLGDAGDEFRIRNGFNLTIWPLLRRF